MELIGSTRNYLRLLQRLQINGNWSMLSPTMQAILPQDQQVRYRQTKHWKPEFKRLRKLKFVKVEIPNFHEKQGDVPEQELRKRMKERGIYPPRPWMERPFHISCTGGIFQPYVPPEGDGKKSIISTKGALQKFEFLEKKSKSMMAVRKIRSYEEEFETDKFSTEAQDIYITAHQHMAAKDKHKLREYVTERCYPEMMHNIKDKTIHWKFLQSLEPPRVVHARVTDVITKENLFAQVTVRFHTQQLLAIYDRFGRLMHGSEILAKDVLEYVVFEKHISNMYGQWRMHEKIIPDWLPPKQPSPITYRLIEEPLAEEILPEKEEVKELPEGDKKLESGAEITASKKEQTTAIAAEESKIEPKSKSPSNMSI